MEEEEERITIYYTHKKLCKTVVNAIIWTVNLPEISKLLKKWDF